MSDTALFTIARDNRGGEIPPGTDVEVRNHFVGTWACGFDLVAIDGDRVRVSRRSDGAVLPVSLARSDVRRH